MNKEELYKYVDTELQALRYYATKESRESFDITKPIYEQLVSIGYTKTVLPLHSRCAHCRVTSAEKITPETEVEDLTFSGSPRNADENIYTGLEFWIMKYPEDHGKIVEQLTT